MVYAGGTYQTHKCLRLFQNEDPKVFVHICPYCSIVYRYVTLHDYSYYYYGVLSAYIVIMSLYTVLYSTVSLCTVMYSTMSLCTVLFHFVNISYHFVQYCINLCHVVQVLAFIFNDQSKRFP